MANDIEFVDGLHVKAPHEKAPSFVKASISIKVADLTKWLAGKTDEWVNIDVKESKGGKWYCSVSNFKPKAKEEEQPAAKTGAGRFDDMKDDVPF
jgi:hypothetical protein